MKRLITFLLTLLVLLCGSLAILTIATSAQAATTYWTSPSAVSTTLTDCDGTSDPGVYCTFASIYAGMAGGDTLKGKAGTYDTRITTPPKTGPSSSQKTTITCETVADPPNGVDPVCIMRPTASVSSVVSFTTANNWSFQNWKFDIGGSSASTVSTLFNVGTSDTSTNWELINSEFTAQGKTANTSVAVIGGNGPNGLIRNNHIHHCQAAANPDCHGIYISRSDLTVENNWIHDIGRSGGNAYGIQYFSSGGFVFSGGIIRFNRIYTANRGIIVGASNTGAEVYGNVMFDIGGSGITARQTNGKVYNNTIDVTSTAILVENNCSASTCTVRNNLATTSCTLGSSTNSNNSCSVTDTSHWIDPNNATLASRDYNLKEGASSIAGGVRTGLPSGYTCVATGSTCDQGAYQAPVRASAVVENATPTIYSITFSLSTQSIRSGTGLVGCTTSNWAIVVAGSGVTESACNLTQTSRVDVTIPSVSNGQSLTDAYTRGALTDNSNIGGTYAKVRTYSAASGTNNVGGAGSAAFAALHYRCLSWYADTSPASTDWLRAEDASNSTLRCPLRAGGYGAVAIAIDCTGANCDPQGFDWYYNRNGGSYAAMTNTTSATAIAFAATNAPSMADLESIAATILTDPYGSYVAGAVIGQQTSEPSVDLTQNSITNFIILYKSDTSATVGDAYCIQPAKSGSTPTSVTQTKTPCIEINQASAGF